MRNRRPMGIVVRVIFLFVIAVIFYFAVYVPLNRVTGALR